MKSAPAIPYPARQRPGPGTSLLVFTLGVGIMAWLRLELWPAATVSLTYGLPLLACLWFPSRRLLWSMTAGMVALSACKIFLLTPRPDLALWSTQLVNILVIAAVVHFGIQMISALSAERARLEAANQELAAREDEISRQNEELQSQTEELGRQNEEIQQ